MSQSDPDRGRTIYLAVVAAVLTSVATTYGLRLVEGALSGGTVEVPDLVGLPRDAASELVQTRGLRLVVTGREESIERARGEVLRQQPLPDSQMRAEGAVEVVLSDGPPAIAVPGDLVGQPVAKARARLTALGLAVGAVSETGKGPPGTVTALVPAPGTTHPPGTKVAITAVPEGIVVPELVGKSIGQAREMLDELGLEVGRLRRDYVEAKPEFQVLRQDPEPGTRVDEGDEVDVVVNE